MPYVLGIDISTTSAKALLVDEHGRVVATHSTPQPISQPKPLWSEQNPSDWWTGVAASIRGALAEAGISGDAVAGIGLTGQMHGLVMLDADGNVLRPSILWNDQRTQAQCDAMTAAVGEERLIRISGSRALTGFTAPKILWVRDHEPEVYARCAHVLLPKDYIRYKLTGGYAMDMSDASGTSLLDVGARRWSDEVLAALDIPAAWMPPVYEGTALTGEVSAAAAAETGLRAGTPVVAGGGDQAAGAVGMGLAAPGQVSVTVGTSGVVFAPLAEYAYESQGRVHAFCHAIPGMWHWMGVMLSAAGALQWYRDTLASDVPFDALVDEAASAPAGSDGLLFLPYLSGERTPHPDPLARGAFIGMTTRHTRAHLTRAVLEGVAFGLKDGFQLMSDAGLPAPSDVRIAGGGARSPLWRQIIADILNVSTVTVNTVEGGAFGAALLASVGVGWFPDAASACAATITTGEPVHPSEDVARYAEVYSVYREAYPALKALFPKLV
ncbi:MAG: xylulokinase [Anaerolineae bacterium]|jgi:xylulokinase|nr:xylulokinase [Anaerolineae bacterium]